MGAWQLQEFSKVGTGQYSYPVREMLEHAKRNMMEGRGNMSWGEAPSLYELAVFRVRNVPVLKIDPGIQL